MLAFGQGGRLDMDQIKIGKFIASCRKKQGMTQVKLAEKLGITDRAISKWENGKSLPDSGIMMELCEHLNINVNELLSGENIMTKEYNNVAEENLVKLKMENEEQAKRMLMLENVIGTTSSVSFMILIFTASFTEMTSIARIVLITLGCVLLCIGMGYCLMIEQKAGFYQCQHCGYKYVPTYRQVLFSRYRGRNRHMICPRCGKRTWQKKTVEKD